MLNDKSAKSSISTRRASTVLVIIGVMIISTLSVIPFAQADEPDTGTVPEPMIELRHVFDQPIDDRTTGNEVWTLDVTEGDVTILLMARNLTTQGTDTYWIDYQFNINYHSGGSLYIAQITTMSTAFVMGGQKISSPLNFCNHMEMTNTPVQYIDGEPSLYCNITFSDIDVYGDGRITSTYDLTLCHHITVGLNQTDVKVEAIFDLSDTRLVDASTNNELAQGETYSVELPYSMMLTLPNSHGEPIAPTGHSDTSLEYSQTDGSGNPLKVSQLKMNNEFSVYNGTGSYGSMGYSSMQYSAQSMVTHGFPGLIYGDTRSIKSDPEITVYYDSITNNDPLSLPSVLMYAVIGIIAVTIGAAVVVIRKRDRRRDGKQ